MKVHRNGRICGYSYFSLSPCCLSVTIKLHSELGVTLDSFFTSKVMPMGLTSHLTCTLTVLIPAPPRPHSSHLSTLWSLRDNGVLCHNSGQISPLKHHVLSLLTSCLAGPVRPCSLALCTLAHSRFLRALALPSTQPLPCFLCVTGRLPLSSCVDSLSQAGSCL